MSINEKGLFYMKPTTFSLLRDEHCCSYNQLKEFKIEQEGGEVILDESDIEKLIKFYNDNRNDT